MSLYQDASLAMIPSAVKDGKLYSIKPSDGSGDFTFSRGSNLAATRVNSSGLIEKGRENLLTYSNAFTSGNWFLSNISLTSGQLGYDGSNNAWLAQGNGLGTSRLQHNGLNFSTSLYALSFYAKAGTENVVNVYDGLWGGIIICTFDLNTGNTTGSAATLPIIDVKMDSVGNGWYRCSVIAFPPNARTNTSGFVRIGIGSTTAANSGNLYIQDAQLEVGLVATDYIETTTTTEVAGITEDLPRLDYSGSCPSLLLEPQRSNLLEQSEYYNTYYTLDGVSVSDNDLASPEGLQNASKLVEDSANSKHRIGKATFPSGTERTLSVFAKAGERNYISLFENNSLGNDVKGAIFNLSNGTLSINNSPSYYSNPTIEPIGSNGWYRCSVTWTSSSLSVPSFGVSDDGLNNSYLGDGTSGIYVYGAMLESGGYSSSYIPTYGSQVTRSQEFNNTSFAGIETEGTLFGEVEVVNTGSFGTPMALSFNDFTSNFILVYKTNTNALSARIRFGGLDQCSITSGTLTEGYHKFAFIYREDDCEFFVDGVSIGTDTSVSIPTSLNVIRQNIGAATNPFEGGTKQLVYFPTALTDSECIALTTL